MAIKALTSVGGFSVDDLAGNVTIVINNTGDVSTGNLTVSTKSTLGAVANVKITGGTNGQVLTTDGTGNLSFTTPTAATTPGGSNTQIQFNNAGAFGGSANFTWDSSSNVLTVGGTAIATVGNITTINSGLMQNGNSAVSITANGNVTVNAVGGTRFTATSTGANVTGTLGVSGNANVGNLGTAQVLATANVTAPQLISNIATGTAPFVVTSTTQVANLSVATAGSATTAGTVTTAAQPNITSVGTLTSLTVSGNANFDTGTLFVDSVNNRVGVNTSAPTYALEVNGAFAATTKSFVINHPTKPNMKLRYGSLEGPENGVYVRGRNNTKTIVLPDYWAELIDDSTITVSLTPVGAYQKLYVKRIENNTITIECGFFDSPDYFYTVFAERKDVDKLTVEI